ncbi:hypothetical protein LV716_05350 [Flagellimonas sp. HMM57]|uniref:hypothetical protein n=1 Tax=unclassified Flagellimonas TaxID=2644544 RepID=UPI0013CF892B|nr:MULTISPECIES: hypothetical protein [unclassified Flagellimonas]UII77198.1 hypothetical protein LV716_05350 [Flagellimonas sp. HMM57]
MKSKLNEPTYRGHMLTIGQILVLSQRNITSTSEQSVDILKKPPIAYYSKL